MNIEEKKFHKIQDQIAKRFLAINVPFYLSDIRNTDSQFSLKIGVSHIHENNERIKLRILSIQEEYITNKDLKIKLEYTHNYNGTSNNKYCDIDTSTDKNVIKGGGALGRNKVGYNLTLGAIIKENDSNYYGITAGHGVKANAKFFYRRKKGIKTYFGEHYYSGPNKLDFCLIKVDCNVIKKNQFHDGVLRYGDLGIGGSLTIESKEVKKYGFFTKGTFGQLDTEYCNFFDGKNLENGLIMITPSKECRPFLKKGDSGSLLIIKSQNSESKYKVIGLMKAKTFEGSGFAVPIGPIIENIKSAQILNRLTFKF